MLRLIFLDIDGVLNQQASAGTEGHYTLDRECIELLNDIVGHTLCKVVIASLWRRYVPLWRIEAMLCDNGYQFGVDDKTQVHWRQDRGKDISDYLEMCADVGVEVGSFVSIDDTPMSIDSSRLVLTDTSKGLTRADANRAISVLMAKS